jgi:hypothetical protein
MHVPLWVDIAIFLFGAVLMFLVFYGIIRLSRRIMGKPTEVAFVGRMKGPSVPVLASFSGLSFLPWAAFTSNNLNPVLSIHPDRIEYRALKLRTRPISDIAEVDVQLARGTVNLVFRFHDSSMTFTANVGQQALAAQALSALPATVSLTPAARNVLDTQRSTI